MRGDIDEYLSSFAFWLDQKLEAFRPDVVAIEAPIVMAGRTTFSTTLRLVGSYCCARMTCWRAKVPTISVRPGEWRVKFIGRGNAPPEIKGTRRRAWLKQAAIDECHRHDWYPADDNPASAVLAETICRE